MDDDETYALMHRVSEVTRAAVHAMAAEGARIGYVLIMLDIDNPVSTNASANITKADAAALLRLEATALDVIAKQEAEDSASCATKN